MKNIIRAEGQKRGYSSEPPKTPRPTTPPPPHKPAPTQPTPSAPKK
jgi:hypothetical protein